jgi:transcription initiation factor TFIIH subunit 2
MSEKDLRPTRYLLSLRYAQEFVREFFEQNPISQLGVLGLRDGLAFRVSDMSGNPTEHITSIQNLRPQDPKGLPSLQNGLEMARGALLYASFPSPTLQPYPIPEAIPLEQKADS